MGAIAARRERVSYLATVRQDLEAHAAARGNTNLSPSGRQKVLAPLEARLVPTHHTTDRAIGKLQATAEGEVAHFHPPNVQRRVTVTTPAKATAAAGLAALETDAGLLALARDTVAASDIAGSYGVRCEAARRELAPKVRKAILEVLDAPHRERAERAIPELIGVKTERLRHRLAGPFGVRDITADGPAARLAACHEAQSYVDPGTGETVSLSDADTAAMLEKNGYPKDIGREEKGSA